MPKYLRHRKDGTIYPWNEILLENPLIEEVTEEQAFPERFVPAKQAKRKGKLNLETPEVPEQPVFNNADIGQDATAGLSV